MEIGYTAPDDVRAVIGSMGRTEDVRFSPGNRRLAIAAFNRARIIVLDVAIAGGRATEVTLTGVAEISSPVLNYPHGLDFLDEERLVVANRGGGVAVFQLPPSGVNRENASPLCLLGGDESSFVRSPGSVSVIGESASRRELLVCDNAGHNVTRHAVDSTAGCSIERGGILLRKWLNLPDGICVSRDSRWIAVSNHNTHDVLIYRNAPALDEQSDPVGALRGAYYPHGLRFSADSRHIFVADAGAPYVHIYAADGQSWAGARVPARSVRIMDDALFMRGRQNPQEGGPKGIDLDAGMRILAATSEHQPLAMFDLQRILGDMPPSPPAQDIEYELGILAHADRLRTRLAEEQDRAARAEARVAKAKARLTSAKKRNPWRIAAPLGRIFSALKRAN
ncbi:MAG: hypothetical protein R3D05_17085 [Dongiaceae bacterium]